MKELLYYYYDYFKNIIELIITFEFISYCLIKIFILTKSGFQLKKYLLIFN